MDEEETPGNGAPHDEEPQEVEVDASSQLETLTDKYLRLAADFDNFRKRTIHQLADRDRYASEEAALALLPVLDNLHRAMAHAEDSPDQALAQGVAQVLRDFESALEKLGITQMQAEGEKFNPELHEAVLGEESEDVEDERVVQTLEHGWKLHDKVLRPAKVKVAHPVKRETNGGN
jgi:molecular chaperone GrpE